MGTPSFSPSVVIRALPRGKIMLLSRSPLPTTGRSSGKCGAGSHSSTWAFVRSAKSQPARRSADQKRWDVRSTCAYQASRPGEGFPIHLGHFLIRKTVCDCCYFLRCPRAGSLGPLLPRSLEIAHLPVWALVSTSPEWTQFQLGPEPAPEDFLCPGYFLQHLEKWHQRPLKTILSVVITELKKQNKTKNPFKTKINQPRIFRQDPTWISLPVPARCYLTIYCELENTWCSRNQGCVQKLFWHWMATGPNFSRGNGVVDLG